MTTLELEVINKLDRNDKQKIGYFVKLLVQQSKYRKLKAEIDSRRREVKKGLVYKHDEIWDSMNV